MKLNISGCRAFVNRNGIKNYDELSTALEIPYPALRLLEQGLEIGYDAVRDIYNKYGEKTTLELIDFGEETLNGFKSKYILVGKILY